MTNNTLSVAQRIEAIREKVETRNRLAREEREKFDQRRAKKRDLALALQSALQGLGDTPLHVKGQARGRLDVAIVEPNDYVVSARLVVRGPTTYVLASYDVFWNDIEDVPFLVLANNTAFRLTLEAATHDALGLVEKYLDLETEPQR